MRFSLRCTIGASQDVMLLDIKVGSGIFGKGRGHGELTLRLLELIQIYSIDVAEGGHVPNLPRIFICHVLAHLGTG